MAILWCQVDLSLLEAAGWALLVLLWDYLFLSTVANLAGSNPACWPGSAASLLMVGIVV